MTGVRRFIYDVWGVAVNTASRMESHGLPGSIQVTQRTCQRLCGGPPGTRVVHVKGKGEMKTWLLAGRLVG